MKTIRVIQLIILLVLLAVLTTILVLGITGNFSMAWNKVFRNSSFSNSVLIYDQVYGGDNLNLVETDLSSSDLEYHFSQTNEIRVVYYGPKSEKEAPLVKTLYENDTLKITQENRKSLFNMISGERVLIYLPAAYNKEIVSTTASGNIVFNDDMKLNSLSLGLSSGNVRINDLIAETVQISVSSGEISADLINASKYSVKMSSGNFKASELVGTGEIISTSGNTDIDNYNGGGLIESTSGNVGVDISSLSSDLKINLTSGNVTVALPTAEAEVSCQFDVLSGSIRTNFGSVDKNITGASFSYNSTNNKAHNLSIKTTSGNIRANVH